MHVVYMYVTTMLYQVLVRKPSDSHFVASVIGLSDVVADGKTEEEAVDNVKLALATQLEEAKVVTIELEPKEAKISPWKKRAGAFANDPTWDDFLQEMTAYRQQIDQDAQV